MTDDQLDPATPDTRRSPSGAGATEPEAHGATQPRPLVERVGMAAIAAGVGTLFAAMAAMSFVSGEPFLGAMSVVGALMTAWVGLRTLLRG